MAKKNNTTKQPSFEDIKKAIVLGLFSSDELLNKLVLKGGNALSLVYGISICWNESKGNESIMSLTLYP